ncbi:hypothetical protein, partial [Mesorhizobium japonicum]|uniref:hypothetical protein n=1 Tax=Mesorhizobium japonicum TaxID=2066070 RepID=UPI003B5BFFCC
ASAFSYDGAVGGPWLAPWTVGSGNPESPLVAPLREILTISTGPVVLLASELAQIDGVESAFLYGSFAARARGIEGPAPNDIDLMVIGRPEAGAIYAACDRVEAIVHRPINPTILTRQEADEDSGFLTDVRSKPTVPIVGALPWA